MEVTCKATKKKSALKKLKKTHSRGGGLPMRPPDVIQKPGAPAGTSSLMSLQACRTLVLDCSFRPIDVVNWQRAVCLDIFDKAWLQTPHQGEMTTTMMGMMTMMTTAVATTMTMMSN